MEYFDPQKGSEVFFTDFADVNKIEDDDKAAVVSLFDKVSPGYTRHMGEVSSFIHQKLANLLWEQVKLDENLNKDCSILDLCCGSGIVGQCLRKAGFTGNLEGVDGSQGMLDEAGKMANVYNKLHREFFSVDGPTCLQKEGYDAITIGHAFWPYYLTTDHLEVILGLLRVGGLLVFDYKYDIVEGPDRMMEYIAGIDKKWEQLCGEGKCELVVSKKVKIPRMKYLETNEYENFVPLKEEEIHERHNCYRKL